MNDLKRCLFNFRNGELHKRTFLTEPWRRKMNGVTELDARVARVWHREYGKRIEELRK